jgi:hypothetical protein
LRLYRTSLEELVQESLGTSLKLNQVLSSNIRVILSIDGFDEYIGGIPYLLKEISAVISKYNVQLFFSGRLSPKFERYFEMKKLTLDTLNKKQIKKIFLGAFQEKSQDYFDIIENCGIDVLVRPLHLALLTGYIRDYGTPSQEILSSILKNKATLFKEVIVNRFLGEYEIKRNEGAQELDYLTDSHIELLSYLAGYMTIRMKDSQSLQRNIIESEIDFFIENDVYLKSFTPKQILDRFIKNGIFEQVGELVSFEPKEVRIFFTAMFIADSTRDRSDFLQFKRDILNYSYTIYTFGLQYSIRYEEKEIWKSIASYFFGLVEPDRIIDTSLEVIYGNFYVITHDLIEQIEINIKLLEQNNPPTIGGFTNTLKVFDFLNSTILNYNKHWNTYKIGWLEKLFLHAHIRKRLLKGKFPKKWATSNLVIKINNRLITNSYYNGSNYIKYIVELLLDAKLEIPYENIQEMVKEMNDGYDKSIITSRLTSNSESLVEEIKTSDLLEILYRASLNKEHIFTGVPGFWEFERNGLKKFLPQLVDYFALKNRESTTFKSVRFINYFLKHIVWLKLKKPIIVQPQTWEYFQNILLIGIYTVRRERHLIEISSFLKYFDDLHRNKLLDKCFEIILNIGYNSDFRLKYIQFMTWNARNEDIDVLFAIARKASIDIADRAVASLLYLVSPVYGERDKRIYGINQNSDISNEEIHTRVFDFLGDLLQLDDRDEIKESILFYSYHWRTKPPEAFIAVAFEYIKSTSDNYTFGFSFLGVLKVKSSEDFLVEVLKNEENEAYHPGAFYALFLLDHSNYNKYFPLVSILYEELVCDLKDVLGSRNIIKDSTILRDALLLGDESILELYNKIDYSQVSAHDKYQYKNSKTYLDWKVTRLKECEN